ncbi:MAG: PepSY domain-containing protein, partial [Sporichthyaceae bacterium]|nr:PepSY domain-containing protein [Sporichthyaceae bacterium]
VGGGFVESVELEREDGGLQWHIDVIKDGTEFDVRIDADTGAVVRFRNDDGGDDRRDDDGQADDRDDDGNRDDDGRHGDDHDDDDSSGPGSGGDHDDNSGPGGGDDD